MDALAWEVKEKITESRGIQRRQSATENWTKRFVRTETNLALVFDGIEILHGRRDEKTYEDGKVGYLMLSGFSKVLSVETSRPGWVQVTWLPWAGQEQTTEVYIKRWIE